MSCCFTSIFSCGECVGRCGRERDSWMGSNSFCIALLYDKKMKRARNINLYPCCLNFITSHSLPSPLPSGLHPIAPFRRFLWRYYRCFLTCPSQWLILKAPLSWPFFSIGLAGWTQVSGLNVPAVIYMGKPARADTEWVTGSLSNSEHVPLLGEQLLVSALIRAMEECRHSVVKPFNFSFKGKFGFMRMFPIFKHYPQFLKCLWDK